MSEVKTSAVPSLDMAALLGNQAANPIAATPLEKSLAVVEPADAAATTPAEVKFSFRSLLDDSQLAQLKAGAPVLAAQMVDNPSQILEFGAPVLERLNSAASQMLEAQRAIDIPQADAIVNDLLREMDGYQAKYQNKQLEEGFAKLKNFLKGVKYSFATMVRDSKPIAEKLDIAALKMQEMELKLRDNQIRGKQLHGHILDSLDDVVAVLAALEEIIDVTRAEALEAEELLATAGSADGASGGLASVEYKGKTITVNELRETHAQLAAGLSQMEQSWFDWRQQFFMGYAQAPSVRNITLVSFTMERRCYTFRTMGIPSAKMTLAAWQQAALAKEAGEKGKALNEGVNKFTQDAFKAMGQTVEEVAMASQMPLITEETIFTVVDSIRQQCEGLVAADRWGRAQREKNLAALQAGEKQISADYSKSRSELIKGAIAGTNPASVDQAPLPEADVLKSLGVK